MKDASKDWRTTDWNEETLIGSRLMTLRYTVIVQIDGPCAYMLLRSWKAVVRGGRSVSRSTLQPATNPFEPQSFFGAPASPLTLTLLGIATGAGKPILRLRRALLARRAGAERSWRSHHPVAEGVSGIGRSRLLSSSQESSRASSDHRMRSMLSLWLGLVQRRPLHAHPAPCLRLSPVPAQISPMPHSLREVFRSSRRKC
jgi:hypothetical protein